MQIAVERHQCKRTSRMQSGSRWVVLNPHRTPHDLANEIFVISSKSPPTPRSNKVIQSDIFLQPLDGRHKDLLHRVGHRRTVIFEKLTAEDNQPAWSYPDP
ncbi:Uncharacterized protein PFLU_5312 [Pseudomonas [fluorescens] SBW25]|uniref:Uncharacterized protein n=1 Tax=Pseudomonas fluorescens (strain SBW25) TaxID=216595 RepID=C3K2B5_PSEFS|nr:Uncharacterized protein PFLU_5312 [Pseudomonas fluorescens SBW25]